MRIGILVSDLPPNVIGGTEIQSYDIAKRLAKKHSVVVFTRHYRGLPREEKKDGFTIKRFRYVRVPVLGFFSHLFFSLNMIRKEKPDILQCMMLTPNGLVGVFARRLFGIKAIPWVRGGDWYLTKGKLIGGRIISFVIRNSPLIFTQAERTKGEVLGEFPRRNIVVINNGIELKKNRARGSKIVFVGNLIDRKGVEYLLMAMRGMDAELIIVGDGPKRPVLEAMAGGNVEFAGRVMPDEIWRYLVRGKIFVLPSKKGEGLPNVILEAMSLGLPVVATKIAGIPDIIEHGKTGFLVEPGNPEQLRIHIKKLLDDDKLRKIMSRNCLMKIKKYSWDNVINKLERMYGEICAA